MHGLVTHTKLASGTPGSTVCTPRFLFIAPSKLYIAHCVLRAKHWCRRTAGTHSTSVSAQGNNMQMNSFFAVLMFLVKIIALTFNSFINCDNKI